MNKFFKKVILKEHTTYFAKLFIFFIIYFFTAKIGLEFDAVNGFATLVWPATGIAIAGILFLGYEYWPAIFFGALLVNVSSGAPILAALGIGLGNMLEALGGIFVARKLHFIKERSDLRNILLFILFCVVLNTAFAATIGVSSLQLAGIVTPLTYKATWIAWWVGDMLGALIIGNLLIALIADWPLRNFKTKKIIEAGIFLIILIVSNLLIFTNFFGIKTIEANNPILVYTIFPLLIWASIRLGRLGVAFAIFITSLISITGTVLGAGPFSLGELSYNLLLLQGYIGVIAGTSMILSSVIEERLKTANELINQKNKDDAILESIGEGVIVVDTNDVILMINNAAQTMLGLDIHDVVGHFYEKIVPIEDKNGILLPIEKRPCITVLASNKVLTDRYYFRTQKNGKLPVTMTTAPIVFEEKVVGIVNVFRDITHEIEVDRAKSEFVSLASHQLRTPLTTIKWYAHALLNEDSQNLSPKQIEYLQEMYHNNERMIELVNSLLNVSRIELGKFTISPVSLQVSEIVDEITHDVETYAKSKEITIEKKCDANIPTITADPNLVRIILQNLLDNSIKYSKEGAGVVHFRIERKGGEILFTVSDTGYGIPKDQQSKIFKKMFRAENARMVDPEGSGLGLYIVKSIVEQSGGRIWFTSEKDKGTTFYVTLPILGMVKREAGSRLIYSQII